MKKKDEIIHWIEEKLWTLFDEEEICKKVFIQWKKIQSIKNLSSLMIICRNVKKSSSSQMEKNIDIDLFIFCFH
jgi:hypothetical protein